ncbi:MAG: Autoinducer 2 sensor kinase/phosphatase LuxQ [Candidatus Parcubacteria bacterium]|jgi:PAS domain S-box-containing protein
MIVKPASHPPTPEELEVSARRLRLIFEQAPFAIVVYAADGECVELNHAWETMFASDISQAVGYNLLKDQALELVDRRELFMKAFAGTQTRLPDTLYTPKMSGKKGRARWFRGILYPVKNDKGAVIEVVLIMNDITDLKEAEEDLIAKNEELTKINKLMVDREMRMIELKRELEAEKAKRSEDGDGPR